MKRPNSKETAQQERKVYVSAGMEVIEFTLPGVICSSLIVEDPEEYPGHEM